MAEPFLILLFNVERLRAWEEISSGLASTVQGINNDLSSMRKTVNCDLASALVASLSEAAREPKSLISCDSAGSYIRGVGRLLLAADGRSVALFGAETAQNRARGKSRGRT